MAFSGTGGDRLLVLSGSYTATASYTGVLKEIVPGLNDYIAATAPDPAQTTLQVNGGSAATVAVGVNATIVVTVKLASGSAVSSAVVSLSASPSGTSSISPASATTNASGQASFTVQGLSSGSVSYSAIASANGTTTTSSSSVAVTYTGAALAVTTATLPTPVVGVAYSQSVATSGGTAPISFSVSAGALPAGLTLNAATGAITGTPTTPGAYSFTVQASDTNSLTATQAYSGTIGAALAVTTATLPTPVVGVAYSQSVATSGGTAPISFSVSAGALPAGLTLNAATGAITGTPTTPGAYSFTVQASDTNSLTATQAYSGTIGAPFTAPKLTLEAPYESPGAAVTLTSSDRTATFDLATPPSNGRVSLTGRVATYVPAAGYIGNDRFTYRATSSTGVSVEAEVAVLVSPPPPPTAESGPDQSIAGDDAAGNSTSTITVETATIDLMRMVRGIVTSIEIAAPPQNGTVSFQTARASRSAAMMAPGDGPRRSSAAALPSYVAVYTPNKGTHPA